MILEHKNTNIFYNVLGEGKPVILIHGFLGNSKIWENIEVDLSQKNLLITIDLLGHGKSDCLGYIHKMEDYAEAILAVITHLNLDKITLVGHSLGGYVALALAEMIPNKIRALCLLNSTTKPDNPERVSIRQRAIISAKKHYNSLVSMSISNLFYVENREKHKVEIQVLKQDALKTPVQGYIAAQEGMILRLDKTEFFKQASFKKLIIAGKKDPVINFEALKNVSIETKSQLIVLKGGHMSQIEDLADLKSALLQFIKD